MVLLLASLAACDLGVVAKGHFNVQRLLGLEEGPDPGYDRIGYTIRLWAPGASEEQVEQLRVMCEGSSPVGDSFSRRIPLTLEIDRGA